jgi:hypothetical protein
MEPQDPRKYSINDFRDWDARGELAINPKFQRRSVWSAKARSFLIDTILRQLPIPMIYVRQNIDLNTGKTIREVVDGQQRLRAVLDYLKGSFSISKAHNQEFGGSRFTDLAPEIQKRFLRYCFAVDVLEGATDAEILNIFARINTYTVTLNAQEKLNAEFFGAFKQFVYNLAYEHLTFWRKYNVLSDRDIVRMGDARITSELIIGMMHGLQDTAKILRSYYMKYDEHMPDPERWTRRFNFLMDQIIDIFGDGLGETAYSKTPLFYSLFCLLYDCNYGLPNSPIIPHGVPASKYQKIASALISLAQYLDQDMPPAKYAPFVVSCKQQTNNIKPRTVRHRFMWKAIANIL